MLLVTYNPYHRIVDGSKSYVNSLALEVGPEVFKSLTSKVNQRRSSSPTHLTATRCREELAHKPNRQVALHPQQLQTPRLQKGPGKKRRQNCQRWMRRG